MSEGDAEPVPKRAREVLAYFLRYPEAADSLEGVARWRVLEEAIHRNLCEVEEALSWLVAHGFLSTQRPHASAPIFSLNPERSGEAQSFVAQSGEPQASGSWHRE